MSESVLGIFAEVALEIVWLLEIDLAEKCDPEPDDEC